MYLCKDGVATKMERFTSSKSANFTFHEIVKQDSGNYSCVYSPDKHLVDEVTASGLNAVFIEVKGNDAH